MHLYSPRSEFSEKNLSRPKRANLESRVHHSPLELTTTLVSGNELQRIFQRLLQTPSTSIATSAESAVAHASVSSATQV